MVDTTITDDVAPVASNVGGTTLFSFGSLMVRRASTLLVGRHPARLPDRPRLGVDRINVVTDGSCDLDAPSDIQRSTFLCSRRWTRTAGSARRECVRREPPPRSDPLSPVRVVPFGEALEGEQHLAEFGLDVFAAVTSDQRGMSRPEGLRCDVGAVEGHAP